MEFSSLVFLFIFLPAFVLLFFCLKKEAHNSFLLIASLFFYFWGDGEFLFLFIFSIIINYCLGLIVDKLNENKLKKCLFLIAILFNIGLLVYFKYSNFILENLGKTGIDSIHLPIGISFYTFQALSFIIDIYRKTVPMDKNPLNFSLYMAFFPKVVMGPIAPYHNLKKQIQNHQRKITADDLQEGIKRFTLGLGKKVLIADSLARPVNRIFTISSTELTAGLSWLGIICYTLQIYFDFSGYTDMAIGIARMCGFTLPENFNFPYFAKSIKEFWQRWHISLANWLRDYLFLPIAFSISRKIKSPRLLKIKAENWAYFIAAFFTFLICGIWHGANWTFVVWGAYYGILLVIEHAGLRKKLRRKPFALQLVYCQLLVIIGWVFFRSPNLNYAFSYLKAMAGFGAGDNLRFYPSLYLNTEVIFFIIIGITFSMPLVPKLIKIFSWQDKANLPSFMKFSYTVFYNFYIYAILILSIMTITSGTYNPFIYFRF